MATSLERELAKLGVGGRANDSLLASTSVSLFDGPAAGKPPLSLVKGGTRASVLYEPRQAANIGVETLFERAENGLIELIALNPRAFTKYTKTLFSRKALNADREKLMPEELRDLNENIQRFLKDLSPHLLIPAALECLEYLVRKYRVHAYNVHSVLHCCLPYHRTAVFRKIIGILYVRGTKWSWVEGLQKTDSAFERGLFTKQCIRNQAFLNFVLQTTKDNAQDNHSSSGLTSFLFFLVSEYVDMMTTISEALLVKLLSYCVFPGIQSDSKDSQAASMLLAVQLSRKLPLSASLVSVLIEEICRGCRDNVELQPNALHVLVSLCASQKDVKKVPSKAIKNLVKMENLVENLRRVTEQHPQSFLLWKALWPSLVDFCPQHENYCAVVKKIALEIDFSSHLDFLVKVLLGHAKRVVEGAKEPGCQALLEDHVYFGELMRALDSKYGAKFDTTLNRAITSKELSEIQKDLVDYFGELFTGTLRQPIGDESMTLQAAIDSAQPQVRKNALTKLLELYSKEGQSSISRDFIHGALLRRIHDEDESISHIAFNQEELLQVAPQTLVQEIEVILREFLACQEDSANRKQKYVKAKVAIKFLMKKFCAKHKSEMNSVVSLVFPTLFVSRSNRKLAFDALKVVSRFSGSGLFENVQGKKKALKQFEKRAKGKTGDVDEKAAKNFAINQSTIVSLSEALCKMSMPSVSGLMPLLMRSKDSEHLGLLVLYSALQNKNAKGAKKDYFVSVCWDYVKRNWNNVGKSSLSKADATQWKNGVPPLEHLQVFFEDSNEAHLQLLEKVLFALLDTITITMTDYLDILMSIMQVNPLSKSNAYIELALEKLCKDATSRENILVQVYYTCKQRLGDKDVVRMVRARALRAFGSHLSSTSTELTKRMEEQALAKKRGALKHMNGNGNGVASGSSNIVNIDLDLCVPWLLSALCEANENICKDAISMLELLSGIIKSGALKYSSKLSINLQSLTDFISGSLANSSAGLATGHITLASTLEAFCNQSKSSKQDKDGLVPFLLEASVRYPYKEIAVNLTSSLGNVRPCSQRIEALGKLLRKELDKYVDSSFGFAHDAKINGEDIRLLSNIMKGFRMNGPCSGTEWFDCFVACMHFPSKHDFSWEVRKSAIDSVSDDLFGIFDEDKKAVLIHSLAYLTYKDDSEIVRSVASEKLSTMEKDSAVVEPFLMSLPKSCKALGAQSGGSQKATKRSKKAPQAEVQNRFKWVREVLEDQENLGLSSTILALEVLDLAEFENLNYLSTPLLETLELLLYLHQAVVDKSGNSRIQSSKVFATAAAAAKTFVNKEIDITSQARYGIELGLQALYNIAGGSVSKTVRVSIVGLSLKCMQFMEQASIHENALDILNQVIGDLPKRELESHASNVFAAVMDSLHLHVQWSASNHKFFKSVLGVLKPFLSNKSTMDQTLDEICRKVAEFERSDQEVFFALAQQIWDGDSLLDMLLEKAFEHAKQGAEEFAGIICEGYSGTKCLEALRNLLSNAGEDSLKMKVSFAIEVIASNRLRYSESDRSAKESTLVEVVKQASKTYGAEEGSEETLQQLYFDLLGEFEEICTPEELFGPLASLCDSGDENLLRTTLDLMSHKLSQQQKKLKAEVGTLVFEAVSGSLFKTTSEETKQACLGTLGQSLKHYKGSSVLELVDKLLLVPQAEEATASAIIFFFGASLIALKSRAIPCLPSVAKHVLGSLEEAIKESSLPVIQASLFTLESLVIHHGGMVGPYLSKLFELWKVLMGSESGNNSEAEALSLLLHVSEDVPVRILLPALLETLNLPCLPAVAKPLVDMLNNLLQTMDHSAIQTNHFDVVNYVLGALDGRRMHKMADSEYSSLECSLVDCFVSLVMKLSEASFRPVFLHVLDWSTKGTVNEGDVLDLKMARGISLFHLVIKITEKLRSIFVPYFKHLMETACGWLEERQKNSKRAKKRSKPSSDESVALWTLKLEVVHSLQKCFAYDTVGFTEENTFDEVLPIILDSLNDQPSSAIAAEVDALAESLLGVTASQRQEDEMELDAEEEDLPCYKNLDLMARETAECLNKMAIAGNNDTVWKRFNSKVLMASRTENPRVKLVCIECVSQLAQFLREDYIVLIAETVPFIAELLEDKEHGVQVACKEFVRKLEEISGEDLSQYMA